MGRCLSGHNVATPSLPGNRRSRCLLGALAIGLLTLLAYSSVFTAGFIWDDDDHVLRILQLLDLDGLRRIWFEPGQTIQYYPLVFSVFWLQLKLWGTNPFPFHLFNILVHAGNALLFWCCLRRLRLPLPFWAALIFAVHPLHVESVAWITELKNLLSGCFYLLAFLCFWTFVTAEERKGHATWRRRLSYVLALLLFVCALLSKTVTCTLPAVFLLLLWWQQGTVSRRQVLSTLPFFLAALILGLITMRVEAENVLAKGPEWDFSIVERLLLAGRASWFHLGKVLWPHPLMFNYPRWQLDSGLWWQYLYPLALLVLLAGVWLLRQRTGRGPLAACLFVVGTNVPVLGFLNVYSMRFSFVADHYYYLANMGVIVLFCAAAERLLQRFPHRRRAETVFFGGIVVLLSLLTWQQGRNYHDKATFFHEIIRQNPVSWFGYSNRAALYADAGEDDLALADIDRSLALKPDEADALHLRGVIMTKRKNYRQAFADFDRSIELRPWRADYVKNRALVYRLVGNYAAALRDADTVLSVATHDPDNFVLRASIRLALEDYRGALADLDRALAVDGESVAARANRGLVNYRLRRFDDALRDFDAALALEPASAETLFNRGLTYVARGEMSRAEADFAGARRLGYRLTDAEVKSLLRQGRVP